MSVPRLELNEISGQVVSDQNNNEIRESLSIFNTNDSLATPQYTTVKKAYGYKKTLLSKLRSQRETNPLICDMVICVDNHRFPVHKCLMILSSDYFDAMLRSGMLETRSNQIELKGTVCVCFINYRIFI